MEVIGYLLLGLSISSWVAGAGFFLRSGYHFMKMLSECRSKRHDVAASLFPILAIILPSFYSERGKYHLNEFQINLAKSIFFGIIFALCIYLSKHVMK